jgi:hypothetical protein
MNINFDAVFSEVLILLSIFAGMVVAYKIISITTHTWREAGQSKALIILKVLGLAWVAALFLWAFLGTELSRSFHPNWGVIAVDERNMEIEEIESKQRRETGIAIGIFLSVIGFISANSKLRELKILDFKNKSVRQEQGDSSRD